MPPPLAPTRPGLPLGGFFGLEPRGAAVPGLTAFWGAAGPPGWVNATSALAALVAHLRPGAAWLPGYVCASLATAVPAGARRYYPLDQSLFPDISALDGRLRPGDLVLAANLFGRAPGRTWRDFVAAHPGVTFVEDCAQALDPGVTPWGDFRLYSPRKLVGVPEGGLLVATSGRGRALAGDLPGPSRLPDPADVAARRAPMQARAAHPDDNEGWHPLHQAAEAAHRVEDRAMDAAARVLLDGLDPAPMIAARKRNFRHLARALAAHAALPDTTPDFAPFGFPVTLPPERRDAVLNRLYSARIFPAVHWRDIAAPPDMTAEHDRTRRLATLPCDHRFGPADMARLAEAFEEALR